MAPEESTSWEIGLKSRSSDRRIEFNLNYYNTEFTGYQTTSSGTDGSGAPVLRSAGTLSTSGFEADVRFRITENLVVAANMLHAVNEFGDLFLNATTNLRGGVPLNAPEGKFGASATYDFTIGDWAAVAAANYSWTSKTLFTNLADANNQNSIWLRPEYGVANASLGLTSPDDRYKISLYVKNLFDEQYVAGLRRISGSVGGAGAVAQALPRDFKRYFGGSLSFNF